MISQDDIVIPINVCPIRNITTKIDGINSFTANNVDELLESYSFCSSTDANFEGLLPPLDPNENCFFTSRRSSFSRCKNNCNRGNKPNHTLFTNTCPELILVSFPVVAGGSALLFIGSVSVLSPLATASLGLFGLGKK